MPETSAPPARSDMMRYGVLALPLAFGGLPLYIHAPDFFAAERGLSLALLGLLLFWLRLFDAVLDPVVGWAGDRWPRARAALVLLGGVLLGGGVLTLFSPPVLPIAIWFLMGMTLASVGHSLISVNLMTLGGLWRKDSAQKSSISATREGFGLAGLILAVVLPSALQPLIGREAALLALAATLAVALFLTLPVFLRWLAQVRLEVTSPPDASPRWRALLPFYSVATLVLLSAAFPAALILMLVRDLLGSEPLAGLFLLTYFASALPGAALAGKLSGRFGAATVWSGALLISIIGFAFALTLDPGDNAMFFAICVVTGFTFGADLVLPPAILSERIEASATQAAATRAYAAFGFLMKAALALAGAIALPLLEQAGFNAGGENDETALAALLFLYAGLPLILRGIAVVALVVCQRRSVI